MRVYPDGHCSTSGCFGLENGPQKAQKEDEMNSLVCAFVPYVLLWLMLEMIRDACDYHALLEEQ